MYADPTVNQSQPPGRALVFDGPLSCPLPSNGHRTFRKGLTKATFGNVAVREFPNDRHGCVHGNPCIWRSLALGLAGNFRSWLDRMPGLTCPVVLPQNPAAG